MFFFIIILISRITNAQVIYVLLLVSMLCIKSSEITSLDVMQIGVN